MAEANLPGDLPLAGLSSQSDESNREQERRDLPSTPAARLSRAGLPSLFVTLQDISKGGCRILRKGRIELQNGEAVQLDLWAEDSDLRVLLPAEICWVRDGEEDTQAGLRFSVNNASLLRQIETYIQHFNTHLADNRPQPVYRQPDEVPPAAAAGVRAEGGAEPLPGDASSVVPVEDDRRRDLAVRERIDRIAAETGIAIEILQAWLRSPEFESTGSRPLDPEVWGVVDKFTALMACVELSPAQELEFCQRYRIRPEQLERWRRMFLQDRNLPDALLTDNRDLMRRHLRDQQEIQRLRHELHIREQAMANTSKLLELSRGLCLLWGHS